MQTVRINVLFGGRAMKEDIEKIFGSELRYLKKLSVSRPTWARGLKLDNLKTLHTPDRESRHAWARGLKHVRTA